MARRKLNAFTADDAGDDFTPSVKTLKAPAVKAIPDEEKPKPAAKAKPKKEKKQKKSKPAEPEVKKAEPKSPEPKPEPPKPVVAKNPDPPPTPPTPAPKPEPVEKPSVDVSRDLPVGDFDMHSVSDDGESDRLVQLVGFFLGEEEYGVDIQRIQEINRMVEVTSVPRTPDFVLGVMNLRGKVIPVINLRKRFGLPDKEKDKDTRIIVVELQGKTIGILVDAVSEVLRIPSSTIEPPPNVVTGVDADYIQGVGKLQDRLLILLDLNKILTKDELNRLEETDN